MVIVLGSSAQEKTPVTLVSEEYSVATNPFWQNWELSAGVQGLSFYSNQETVINIPKGLFRPFRTQLGVAVAVTKWFAPEIGLRTKAAGLWGRSVISDNKEMNSVKYMHLHEDVMVNITNIFFGYDTDRRWNIIPYGGIGMARNFDDSRNALTLSLGLQNSLRLAKRLKGFLELAVNITGDELDNATAKGGNFFSNHDRWLAAEMGIALELGNNKWNRVPDMDDVEVVPWEETKRELHHAQRQVKNLTEQVEDMQRQLDYTEVVAQCDMPEISIFFDINSAELTNKGQLENIMELVAEAKRTGRTVVITGYADSDTGNAMLNERLSARRADTVAKALMGLGIDEKKIKTVIGGGVATLSQSQANRRAVVTLKNE